MAQDTQKIWQLYRITNKVNGKIYIGQAQDYEHRWSDHRRAVKNNRPTQIVHHAMIKYGLDNFVFEVIAGCKTQDDANWAETELVKQYDSYAANGKGYNATLGGMNAPKTEEWKQKISQILMGHEVTKDTRDKVSKGNSGKIRSDEFKKDVGNFWRGRERSEEHRNNLSESLKGNLNAVGNKNGLGYKHTEEAKRKIGEASKRSQLLLDTDQQIKECSKCHQIKSLFCFRKLKHGRGGVSSACKDCLNTKER